MQFYCIRHTQPDIHPGICYGQKDIELKKTYNNDLSKIKKILGPMKDNKDISKIFSSPLSRCSRLAVDLSKALSLACQTDERLKEMNFGLWEGQSYNTLWEEDPCFRKWSNNWKTMNTAQGESLPELINRVRSFIEESQLNNSLIITHSGVIRVMMHLLEGKTIESCFDIKINFAQIISFQDLSGSAMQLNKKSHQIRRRRRIF